jgi:hydroxymethylpyrimidine pyrophosphatase-like HAD family hydrolase
MKAISKACGIDISEVIAIGDNLNDKQMIIEAGLGIAIGNGRAETIAAADYVAPSNNESAIAHVIDKFCRE